MYHPFALFAQVAATLCSVNGAQVGSLNILYMRCSEPSVCQQNLAVVIETFYICIVNSLCILAANQKKKKALRY